MDCRPIGVNTFVDICVLINFVFLKVNSCVCVSVCVSGLAHEESPSTSMDLDIELGAETECRDRGLGGTMEVNTEDCFLETPMMSMANQTGDSSCPLWLRKVCYCGSTNK